MAIEGHDPADPQKARVYLMEYRELQGHRRHYVRPKTLRLRIARACRDYEIDRPRLVIRKNSSRFGYCTDTSIELLYTSGCNYLTLAHELAHWVAWKRHKGTHDHGPTWMRIYADLLYRWRLIPLEGMRAICRKHGIKMA